jgi:hypothetical protein
MRVDYVLTNNDPDLQLVVITQVKIKMSSQKKTRNGGLHLKATVLL